MGSEPLEPFDPPRQERRRLQAERFDQLWAELRQLDLSDEEIGQVCIPGAVQLAARSVPPPPELHLTAFESNAVLRVVTTYALIMTRDWQLPDSEKERRMQEAFEKILPHAAAADPLRWRGFVVAGRKMVLGLGAMLVKAPRERVNLLASGILTAHLKNIRDVGDMLDSRKLTTHSAGLQQDLAEDPVRYEITNAMFPEWGPSCAISASHTAGVWKIVGKPPGLPEPVSIVFDRDPERLRAELTSRGYQLRKGQLLVEQFTGIEIWAKPEGSNT